MELTLHVRNFLTRAQTHRIEIHTPPGLIAEPPVLAGELTGEARGAFPIHIRATAAAKAGVNLVAFDVTRDGERLGEWFDCVLQVQP